ncbi:hypothetical protein [Chryseobacterium sp. MFBS3-17]|uniref:hypothetical protein n=1 Tax=Chryseobacterium sp. MFBS3-17 TaxID=2886689 RepID=UPI001D0DF257|nr:hypothetical protein [Chryseobacterium sp. MFBS3-17]MCC2590322.1 hypothetical protein [Chryseobacterium sp. MFBS3-17]
MDKGTKKSTAYNSYNKKAIEALVVKYGLSEYYIRQSIAGRRLGVVPDKLKKEYKSICDQLEATINNFKNQ